MIFKKGSDDEPTTRRVSRSGDDMPITGGRNPEPPTVTDFDHTQPNRWSAADDDQDEATRPLTQSDRDKVRAMSDFDDEDPKTQVVRPRRVTEDNAAAKDPVVGWLVVISGPGRGNAMALTYGLNSIGRNRGERICLDFGDPQISREKHAMITYDPRGRKFYVQHGGGQNLTYLGDAPLLVPAEVKGGEVISLGDTRLKFVPLCGADFDWADE